MVQCSTAEEGVVVVVVVGREVGGRGATPSSRAMPYRTNARPDRGMGVGDDILYWDGARVGFASVEDGGVRLVCHFVGVFRFRLVLFFTSRFSLWRVR